MPEVSLKQFDQGNEEDVLFLYETRSHWEVTSCLFGNPPSSVEAHREWLRKNVPYRRLMYLAMVDGKRVGYCHAYGFEGDEVELGFVVHPDEQGKGYGGQMVDLFVDEVSMKLPDRKIHLEVRVDNEKAMRLYEKHGFHRKSVRMEL